MYQQDIQEPIPGIWRQLKPSSLSAHNVDLNIPKLHD